MLNRRITWLYIISLIISISKDYDVDDLLNFNEIDFLRRLL